MPITTITCSTDLKFKYDKNSKDFKAAFAGFRKHINPDGQIQDMLEHVCHNILHFGHDTLVEGVGYVKPKHQSWTEVPKCHSGIELLSDCFTSFDYE